MYIIFDCTKCINAKKKNKKGTIQAEDKVYKHEIQIYLFA